MIKEEYKNMSMVAADHQTDSEDDKKKTTKEIIQDYQKTNLPKLALQKSFFKAVAEQNILSKFLKPTPQTLVECGFKTEHHDARVKKLEVACCFLHLIILLFSFAYVAAADQYELSYQQEEEEYQYYLLLMMHFLSLYICSRLSPALVILSRYQAELELMKMRYKLSQEETIWSGNKKLAILIEMAVTFLHPQIYMNDWKLRAYNSIVGIYTVSNYNDVLVIASMFRVIYIASFSISMTGVSSNRAKRIALMHGYELNFTNILKTITKESPFKFVIYSGLISIVLFAYCLRICER